MRAGRHAGHAGWPLGRPREARHVCGGHDAPAGGRARRRARRPAPHAARPPARQQPFAPRSPSLSLSFTPVFLLDSIPLVKLFFLLPALMLVKMEIFSNPI